jgi:hypothetical protein
VSSPKKREKQMIETTTQKMKALRTLKVEHYDEDEGDYEEMANLKMLMG